MVLSKENNRKIGILLQYAQMALGILVSFFYTPTMLEILGEAEYGIYSLSNSIISYLNLLSLGFGASYIRFYSRYKKENNQFAISKLNGVFLLTFLGIGFVAFICGMILSNNIELFFNETYSESDKQIAHALMRFMAFNLAMSFPTSVFISYITAQEKFVFQKMLNMVRTVVGPFLTLPALLMGWGSYGMVMVTTVVGLSVDIANVVFCLSRLKMKFCFKSPDFLLLREIAGFSLFIALNQIIDQINWATDKIVLGKVCSSAVVAHYAIGAQINTYFTQFSTAVSSVFAPQIHRIENSGMDKKKIDIAHTKLFTKVGRVQFMLLMLVLTGFIFFGKYFVSRWAGEQFATSYYVSLLLMCPAVIPLIQNIGIEVQRAKNKHQFRSIAYLFMAIFNVIISVFLAKKYGDVGAALGTTISLVIANGIMMNIFYHKVIGLDILFFWKGIAKCTPALVVPIIFGLLVSRLTLHSLLEFCILAIIYAAVYCISMYKIGMNSSEKELVKKMIGKVIPNDKK